MTAGSEARGGVQGHRSRQGKLEKSLVSFMATYPSWQPDAAAKQLLATLADQPQPGRAHFPYTAHIEQLAAGLPSRTSQDPST